MATSLTDNGCRTCTGSTGTTVQDHEDDPDPHPQYLTQAEGDAAFEALGDIAVAVSAHEAAANPHPTYLTQAEGDAAYAAIGAAYSAEAARDAAGAMMQQSLIYDDPLDTVELEGDAASPGLDMYWGTGPGSASTKGFFSVPGGGGKLDTVPLDEAILDYPAQPHLSDRDLYAFIPMQGRAYTTPADNFQRIGIDLLEFGNDVDDYGSKPKTASSFYGMQRAFRMTTLGTANDQNTGLSYRYSGWVARGSASAPAYGGFHFSQYFGIADGSGPAHMFCGLHEVASKDVFLTPVTTGIELIGVGHDEGDTNLRVYHSDGSGAVTAINLGANFPVADSTDWYQLELFCAPGGSVHYKVTRHNTGDVATGTLAADLPAAATMLGWGINRNSGGANTVVAIDIGQMICIEGPAANVLV